MKFPWMPFYTEDFRLATLDLNADEIGVYFVLIMLAWNRDDGSVPGDMLVLKKMLQRCIANFHGLTFNRIVPKLLRRYFQKRGDGNFYQHRVEKELAVAREISENRSRIARERWARVKENNWLADASAMTIHTQRKKEGLGKQESLQAALAKLGEAVRINGKPDGRKK